MPPSERTEKSIWLWDTPHEIWLVIELPRKSLDPAIFVDYTEGLFLWNQHPRELQSMFSKRAQIDNIKAVTANDIDVTREGDSVVLSASYQTKVKLFGNLSACIDFEASSRK